LTKIPEVVAQPAVEKVLGKTWRDCCFTATARNMAAMKH
jgi:hypothetical protein